MTDDNIDFNLYAENDNLDVSLINFNIVIYYSIHRMLPTITLKFKDMIGVLQEYIVFYEGKKLKLVYKEKDTDNKIELPFVIMNDDRTKFETQITTISADMNVFGIHEFFNNEEIKSKAYNDTSSEVIKKIALLNGILPTELNVEDSDDMGFHYQPLITDKDFIEKIILKNVYSSQSKTPYFCYFDLKNKLNFVSYNYMINNPTNSVLQFFQNKPNEIKKEQILDWKFVSVGSSITKNKRQRQVLSIDENGQVFEEEDKITSYPKNIPEKYIPIAKATDNKNTGYIYLDDYPNDILEEKFYKGKKINSMKDTLFLERLFVTTYLNFDLDIGKMVKIEFPISDGDKSQYSEYYTDNYLIEEIYVVWNNKSRMFTMNLIVSRKNIKLYNTFKYQDKFLKG